MRERDDGQFAVVLKSHGPELAMMILKVGQLWSPLSTAHKINMLETDIDAHTETDQVEGRKEDFALFGIRGGNTLFKVNHM